MMGRRIILCLIVTGLAIAAAPVLAAPLDNAEKFAQGQELLADGNFEGALQAFTAATKANPDNEEYRQQATLLRRIIQMRTIHAGLESDDQRWLPMAKGLHAFYHDNGIYGEALKLDRQVYAQDESAESAVNLARTQLALDMNAEAAKLLSSLPEEQATPEVRLLNGVALARLGKTEEARQILKSCPAPEKPSCDFFYDRARLCALLNDSEGAAKDLAGCLENCPPGRLAACR
ncbi:MAG: hypothetical protein ABIG44_05250, partial [Planctomycetota bacterium]